MIQHPNVVAMFDSGHSNAEGILVLEYMNCPTLEQILNQHGPMAEVDIKPIGQQLLTVLEYVHGKNIVHKDIKPANIFFTKDKKIKLMDWGLSAVHEDRTKPCTLYRGSPLYCAPELLRQLPYEPFLAEMWTVGIIMYELFYDEVPFFGQDEKEFFEEVFNKEVKFPKTVTYSDPDDLNNTIIEPLPIMSANFQDFVTGLLDKDPQCRLTLPDAVQHPFII